MHAAAAVARRVVRTAAFAAASTLWLACTSTQSANAAAYADIVLVNGKVVVYDGPPAQAIAISGERILAVGSNASVRTTAGATTRSVDLGGRTVIPGLIDSHIHAIRAGLTYTTEIDWTGADTLTEALARMRTAAQTAPRGSWLVVAGGWTDRQFREGRPPTQDEVTAAAPDHRIYVQQFYSRVLLDPRGADALGIASDPELSARVRVERDPQGRPTGWISADNRTVSALYDRLPRPSFAQKVEGTKSFFRRLNAHGITGILDPGGYNLGVGDYQALFRLWQERALNVRVRYSLSAPRRGRELEDFTALTAMLPMGYGDGMLRFNGIGENVTWGFYNNDSPDESQRQALREVLDWAASQRMTATFHWHNDRAVHHLLDVLEYIDARSSIAGLRWSVAHLNDASPATLERLQRLKVGWLAQNAFYFRGEAFIGQRGTENARRVPPLVTARRMNIPVGAGTDAHRVMWPNPFVSLKWMLDGKTITGVAMRAPEELPTRIEALQMYTAGSAWFSFEEQERGTLAVGRLADLAVLDRDYLSTRLDDLPNTRSLLTMVGGRIVYAAGPYAALEEKVH